MMFKPLKKSHIYQIGFFMALSAAIFEAFADVLPKPVMNTTDPLFMTGLMFLINGVFFTIIIQVCNRYRKNDSIESYKSIFKTKRKSFHFLIYAGLAEITATTIFYFGLKNTSAANSAVLGSVDVLFTVLLVFLIFREHIKRKEIIPFGLILVGSIFLPIMADYTTSDFELSSFVVGDILVVFSGLFYGVEIVLLKVVNKKLNIMRIIEFISYIGGAIGLIITVLVGSSMNLHIDNIIIITFTAIFGIGISLCLMMCSIKYIGAIKALLIFSTTTIFGILFAGILLGESITGIHLIAFVLIFVGIFLVRERLRNYI